jgi:hypothetical protein
MSDPRHPFDPEDSDHFQFVELVCPTCHAVSGRIAARDVIAQRAFDDLHRHCYINAVPDRRSFPV